MRGDDRNVIHSLLGAVTTNCVVNKAIFYVQLLLCG